MRVKLKFNTKKLSERESLNVRACTCQHERVSAAASNAGNKTSCERLHEARFGKGIRR